MRGRRISGNLLPVSVVDVAPFAVVFLVALFCGRVMRGWVAWLLGLALPLGHFVLSIATGRAGDDLLSYVVPVNVVLLVIAGVAVLLGRSWRRASVM